MRRTIATGVAAFVLSAIAVSDRLAAQAPSNDTRPTFEAASVKPSAPNQQGQSVRRNPGGRATANNMPLRDLVRFVLQVQSFQIEGMPAWAASQRYDIVAKAAGDPPPVQPGGPVVDPMILMLRSLIEDRFKLTFHRETKELPIYALVMAKPGALGPELQRSTTDCLALYSAATAAARESGGGPARFPDAPDGRPLCGIRVNAGTIAAGSMPMSQFAGTLAGLVSRTVVDRTALDGAYDFKMTFTPDPGQFGPGAPQPPAEPLGPSLFTALQEQLGLKLESTRGPVEVVVIDRLEQLTPD